MVNRDTLNAAKMAKDILWEREEDVLLKDLGEVSQWCVLLSLSIFCFPVLFSLFLFRFALLLLSLNVY